MGSGAAAAVAPASGHRSQSISYPRRDAAYALLLGATAAAFYVAPSPRFYVPAFVALAVLTWLRLDLALLLVPLFVPYFMAPKHLGNHVFAPSEIFVLLDCVVGGSYAVVRRPCLQWTRVRDSPFLLPGGLFLIAATISAALAVDRHHALEWYRWVILEPLAYFVLLMILSTRRSWPWIFGALLAAGLSSALIGLWQYGSHTNLTTVAGTSVHRIHALYGSPDNLGLLFDRVLPVWFAVAISSLALRQRIFWWFAGVPIILALVLTFSRGAWVGVLFGCLFVMVLRFSWGRWLLLGAVLLGVIGLALEGPKLVGAFRSGQTNTAHTRVDVWRSSIHMIRDHPIFGVGPDNFVHYYAPTRKENLWQRQCEPGLGYMQPGAGAEPCLSHPHDEFLDFWLSTGVLGLASFIWIEFVFWRQTLVLLRNFSRRLVTTWPAGLLVGSAGAMTASLVHGVIDNSYFLTDLATIFWLLCAFVSLPWAAWGDSHE